MKNHQCKIEVIGVNKEDIISIMGNLGYDPLDALVECEAHEVL